MKKDTLTWGLLPANSSRRVFKALLHGALELLMLLLMRAPPLMLPLVLLMLIVQLGRCPVQCVLFDYRKKPQGLFTIALRKCQLCVRVEIMDLFLGRRKVKHFKYWKTEMIIITIVTLVILIYLIYIWGTHVFTSFHLHAPYDFGIITSLILHMMTLKYEK